MSAALKVPDPLPSTSTLGSTVKPLAFAGGLLTFTLLVALLYFARPVVVPVALAGMLAFVLNPLVLLLHRWGFSRVPAVISTVVLSGIVIGCLIWLVGVQLTALVDDLPQYEHNVRSKIAILRRAENASALNRMRTRLEDMVRDGNEPARKTPAPTPVAAPQSPVKEATDGVFAGILGPIQDFSPAFEALGEFLFALVLAIFMLTRREDLRNRLLGFAGKGSLTTTTRALDDAGQRISRYMVTQVIINGTFGVAVALGLFLIGVPYFLLWGLCAGILRYIPYAGALLAAAAPLAVSVMASSGW
jgi:predicted PurR-regulated permease PerM